MLPGHGPFGTASATGGASGHLPSVETGQHGREHGNGRHDFSMCGFLGVLQRSPVAQSGFREAVSTIAHRGPDHTGVLFDSFASPAGTVHAALGHCRLAIIDLDPRSHQPFTDGGRHLIYNGEIYNFRDIARSRFDAATFRTNGDTEVVHRVLTTAGTDALEEFNGMWAACLFDTPRRTVTCCRDRYGVKPLFYWIDDERFVVASEAKAIFRYLGRTPAVRSDKVDQFLASGMCYADPQGATFFSGLHEVRAGHAIEFAADTWQVTDRPWHDFRAACSRPGGDLRQRVEDAVLSRLISDRPVGLLLSGGIDSSLILSVLVAHGRQDQVRCFIGETGSTVSEDAAYARQCAARAGIAAIEVTNTFAADAFDRVMSMFWHHEKPFPLTGNSVAMHEMYARIAGHGVPVVLDGTGGDEVFGGYWDRYLGFAVRDAVDAGDLAWLAGLLEAAKEDEDLRRWTVKTLRPLGRPADQAGGMRFADIYGREGVRSALSADPLDGFGGRFADALRLDAAAGRLAEWIWHNDRNSMAHGIENRSPFLDRGLIPMMSCGYADAFVGGWNKIRLRRLFDAFADMPTQWRRQKQGFRWPQRTFIRANKDRVLDLIAHAPILGDRVDVDRFVKDAGRDDGVLLGDFTGRLLSVAGFGERFACA
jgi:asparagine synthase (glutamine-hydrolysing)